MTGATGFIGTALVGALIERGEECVVLSRRNRHPWPGSSVRLVVGNPTVAGRWEKDVDGCDAVINLAGERIVSLPLRWTDERKRQLRASRITTTHNVVTAIRLARKPPRSFLSGSAIGFYGNREDEIVDEMTPPGQDFLAQLCVDWEAAAREAADRTSVTLLRTGPVLGRGWGGLTPLMLAFKTGVGGPWGDGRQWWSWIHLADEIGLIQFAMDRGIAGPINLTAPNPITVEEFAQALGKSMHRPAVVRMPEFALRLALGEAADPLFLLQRALPKRAIEAGYQFRFPTIDGALREILTAD